MFSAIVSNAKTGRIRRRCFDSYSAAVAWANEIRDKWLSRFQPRRSGRDLRIEIVSN